MRSFRINARQEQIALAEALLEAEGYRFEPEPFSPLCFRLTHEPAPLGSSLAAFFGYIYIQDRSSMLPPLALAPEPGASVLDMAASPGGKTGFLAQLAGPGGLVVANEPARERLATLRANLARSNRLQVVTTSYGGERLPLAPESCAYILLDPPCSGWGTAAKNPRVLSLWHGAKTGQLENIQRQLLRRAAKLLKPGGRLLYSTCTTNAAENQAQTTFAKEELGLEPLPLPEFAGFVFERPSDTDLLVKGRESQAQGFYLTLLTKKGMGLKQAQGPEPEPRKMELVAPEALAGPCVDPALLPRGRVGIFEGKARFLPEAMAEAWTAGLNWQGALLGKWRQGAFLPDARLRVLLPAAGQSAIVFEEIKEIRRLLSGASIAVNTTCGHAGIFWRNLPLGICRVKNGRLLATFA